MRIAAAGLMLVATASAASAVSPRDALTQAVFTARDKRAALLQIASADTAAAAQLARAPGDAEALLTHAMATGYRAKLTGSRGDALSAKAQFEALVARNPRDPEAQAALGGWHLGAVATLGSFMARGGLGARKGIGLDAVDRAVALGGDRALFRALAALLRLQLDPADARGLQLAIAAARSATPTQLDRIMQRRAAEMAIMAKGGDAKLIRALADRLLPLGQIAR